MKKITGVTADEMAKAYSVSVYTEILNGNVVTCLAVLDAFGDFIYRSDGTPVVWSGRNKHQFMNDAKNIIAKYKLPNKEVIVD